MTNMTWTQKPPQSPGWYWFRNRKGIVGVVEVDAVLMYRAKTEYLSHFLAGNNDFAMWWSDRAIDEPKEEVTNA